MRLTTTQRLVCVLMDTKGIGAIRTDIGWCWRSDIVLSTDAADAAALALLDDFPRDIEPARSTKAFERAERRRNRQENTDLDAEIAGLLPEEDADLPIEKFFSGSGTTMEEAYENYLKS